MRRKRRNSDAQPQLHAALVWELLCRVAMASRLSPGHRRVSCLRWLREWCRTPGVTDARAAKGGATAHAPATVRVAQGGTATFLPLRRCQSMLDAELRRVQRGAEHVPLPGPEEKLEAYLRRVATPTGLRRKGKPWVIPDRQLVDDDVMLPSAEEPLRSYMELWQREDVAVTFDPATGLGLSARPGPMSPLVGWLCPYVADVGDVRVQLAGYEVVTAGRGGGLLGTTLGPTGLVNWGCSSHARTRVAPGKAGGWRDGTRLRWPIRAPNAKLASPRAALTAPTAALLGTYGTGSCDGWECAECKRRRRGSR
jgi:hypothetical protein